MTPQPMLLTGNQAAAAMAYKLNEVCVLYPITPSSEMSESVTEWSAANKKNIYGLVPVNTEMQSEAGVAGTLHGALQTGSLATTFTSSQGLLLMLPNLYKIAGELNSCVIHVATRSIATHALSVFGDHSDVMSVRQSGFAMLNASTVQEAQDMALIAQAISLRSRIPFIHFFDGFRTSHEFNMVEEIAEDVILRLIPHELVRNHRRRALSPDAPCLRGSAQGPDAFFENTEARNSFYRNCPSIARQVMDEFGSLTGRSYQPFEYHGHPEAENVLIIMGSAYHAVRKTADKLNDQGARTGVLNVRLYRPFDPGEFLTQLPRTVKNLAVLDRTREHGSTAEPLCLDVMQAIGPECPHFQSGVRIIGGRYGLGGKEFTPAMAAGIFRDMQNGRLQHGFTVGITDDLGKQSVQPAMIECTDSDLRELLLLEEEGADTDSGFARLLGKLRHSSAVQGYRERQYRKSNASGKSHIRLSRQPVNLPCLVRPAETVILDEFSLRDLQESDISDGGTLIIVSVQSAGITAEKAGPYGNFLLAKKLNVFHTSPGSINGLTPVQTTAYRHLEKTLSLTRLNIQPISVIREDREEFSLADLLLSGNEIPVSMFPADGTYPTGNSWKNPGFGKKYIPAWDNESCTQCGLCSMVCPQAALRIKAFPSDSVPHNLRSAPSKQFNGHQYIIGINPEQCNACGLCMEICETDSLNLAEVINSSKNQWKIIDRIPEFDRTRINPDLPAEQQLMEPLFNYSPGVSGCGEALYLKLISQLFGDRAIIANATGSSSIFGGALPTTPWSVNSENRGPAWSNSLFEDTAEFGLGFRLSLDLREKQAREKLLGMQHQAGEQLTRALLTNPQENENQIRNQREMIRTLRNTLGEINSEDSVQLAGIADSLVRKSVWIVGGDGWAYDIGFGGLDHVMASGKNVNILVLDNEIYSNTGGQMSKATPWGAKANLSPKGKNQQKKDLGKMMMTYDHVYVASVAIGADPEQTLRAFREAEQFDGPSLILAYCHSPEHGYQKTQQLTGHKLAVGTGQWLLYRYQSGKSPSLTMDSPEPKKPLKSFYRTEKRFSHVTESQLREQEKRLEKRRESYMHQTAGAIFHA